MSELSDRLKKCADELIEHCDAVLILASVETPDGADLYRESAGPWHSTVGMLEHFKWANIAMRMADKIKEEQQDE